MKKLIAYVSILVLIVSLFTGCSGSGSTKDSAMTEADMRENNAATESTMSEADITPGTEDGSEPNTSTVTAETEEVATPVEITLPATLFENEDMASFDLDVYVAEQELISAGWNEDGSMTISMTQTRYDKMVADLTAQIESALAELINSEDTPYVKEITHNEDFTEVIVKVIREDYENAFDFMTFTVGMNAMAFQMCLGKELHSEVTILDQDTGDVITTIIWPDTLG